MSDATLADEAASPREIAATLRRELAGHNLRVVLLAVLAAIAAAILWAALYVIAYWLTLLFLTAARGLDTPVPRDFRIAFFAIAGGLLAFAWIDRKLHPDDRTRDKRTPGEIVLEFVLAIPRVTLAVGSTLTAWQPLNSRELARAASFLEQLEHEGRIRLQTMPIEIPNERARERILFALQLTQFIEIRRENHDYWVTLSSLRPRLTPVRRD